ncbi:MAG: acyl-CoA dehydrogenase family protein [Rhodospirillales bacterium]
MRVEQRATNAMTGAGLMAAAATLRTELVPGAAQRDLQRIIPYDHAQRLRALGIHTALVPRQYGGPQASYVEFASIMLQLGAGDPNLAQMLQPHFVLLDWLMLDATEAMRRRCYGAVINGAIIANAFAERETKTPGEFAAQLSKDGENYRLDGRKFYCTGSLIADQLYVMCKLPDGSHALAILPKDRAGVEVLDDWDGMGQRTTGSGTTMLTAVKVAAEEVMPVPHWGKERSHLGAASQLAHAAIDAGIALAALDDAIDYGRNKARPVAESGVDRASDDPYVLQAVGEMSVIARAAQALVLSAAAVLDEVVAAAPSLTGAARDHNFARSSIAVAEAKAAANDASMRVGEMLFRVAGASSTLRKYDLDRHWRNARTHTTHDPVAYKYKAIGEYLLNRKLPPISTKI